MMTGELFLLAWILDATLAGGRVMCRGDLGYNITRQIRRFHVEVRRLGGSLSVNAARHGCETGSTASSN